MKEYTENGIKYIFDHEQMNTFLNMKQHERMKAEKKKITKEWLKQEMAKKLVVSPETIKSWLQGTNSPGDLELVKGIAEYLGVDYHELLQKKEQEEEEMAEEIRFMAVASEKQKVITRDRVREIYEALVDAIDASWNFFYTEYYSTDEWSKWQLERFGNTTFEQAEDQCRKVNLLLIKYMLDIPRELYRKIRHLFWTAAESVLMDTTCAFSDPCDEEEAQSHEEIISDMLRTGDEFQEKKFAERMREVFGAYIVE